MTVHITFYTRQHPERTAVESHGQKKESHGQKTESHGQRRLCFISVNEAISFVYQRRAILKAL